MVKVHVLREKGAEGNCTCSKPATAKLLFPQNHVILVCTDCAGSLRHQLLMGSTMMESLDNPRPAQRYNISTRQMETM